MPMMISKLTQISCWVIYNDLNLLLSNYMLLMVVIKPCETSILLGGFGIEPFVL
jgi:hypothetical protein